MSSDINNINLHDFKNLCRTCMSNWGIKFPQDNVILTVFYKLTDIHFETNNELPQQICLKCFEKINEIHEFSFKCKQTHFSLLKCLNNLKNSRINVKQELLQETSEPLETKEEITIDEHRIGVFEDEIVIDELKSEKHVNNVFEEIFIPETSIQNINCSDEDLSKTNKIIKEDQIEEKTDDNVHLDGSNKDTNSSNNSDTSYIKSAETNKETKGKTYECDVCNKPFTYLKSLNTHKSLQICKRSYKCKLCSKIFSHVSNLNSHMRTHTGERPFKCKQCLRSFSHFCNLTTHMRMHTGERPYTCDQCGKSFTRFDYFKLHIMTHSSEQPHKCNQCLQIFSHPSSLRAHMRTHTGERHYKCEQCLKMFSKFSNLKTHMRTHTDERPFKCAQCEKSFARLDYLQKHTLTHSGESPYKCKP